MKTATFGYGTRIGHNIEAACRGWKRWEDERLVKVACVTCGGRVEVKNKDAGRPVCCSWQCAEAARQEAEASE